MSRTRIEVNLIDADGCTFNRNHQERILYCIKHYSHLFEEYANKASLSAADKEVIDYYVQNKIIKEQKKLSLKKGEYQSLINWCEEKIRLIDSCFTNQQSDKIKFSNFIYSQIQLMEKVCPNLLRHIYRLSNNTLIKYIKKQAGYADQQILMLGSNRQCYIYDELNAKNKGTSSIYIELDELLTFLNKSIIDGKINLDKFTLADLHTDNGKSKSHYNKILDGVRPEERNAFDSSKINIVYAFAHRIANKYADAEITIHFWDDISSILLAIKTFFSTHPYLLPNNVKLNLHQYKGEIKSTEMLVGTGVIDQNYKLNTMLMAVMCGYDNDKNNNVDFDIAKSLNVPEFLQARRTGWELLPCKSHSAFFKPKTPAASLLSSQNAQHEAQNRVDMF